MVKQVRVRNYNFVTNFKREKHNSRISKGHINRSKEKETGAKES